MRTTNPFPGMNPFLEGSWADVHTALIGFIREAISDELPLDLTTRAEEDIEVGYEETATRFRGDVVVSELWPPGLPGVWQPEGGGAIAVTEPEIIEIESLPHRWIEIRDLDGRLVTVIEILSPSNKEGAGRRIYLQKQQDLLSAGVNLVEIDLLRSGLRACLPAVVQELKPSNGVQYLIIASRALRPTQREVYYCPLQEALPTVRVPLRVTDLDVPLAIQPLIDRVYRTGRYWQVSHREVPAPPLPPDDATWLAEQLQSAGLR